MSSKRIGRPEPRPFRVGDRVRHREHRRPRELRDGTARVVHIEERLGRVFVNVSIDDNRPGATEPTPFRRWPAEATVLIVPAEEN